jgi:hypothetical protein
MQLSLKKETIALQHVAKSIATCKNNPYIINQSHMFSKNIVKSFLDIF